RRHNFIDYVKDDNGNWLGNRLDISNAAICQKFQNLFSFTGCNCPSDLEGLVQDSFSFDMTESLAKIPSDGEIKQVLSEIDPNKAPGLQMVSQDYFIELIAPPFFLI
ncbi:hypothetical protein PanWU01x14_047530, partial [Parasponia andersonii]